MNNITILDCTLRDGGYINEWRFGETVIRRITDKLAQSNLDIIECGFLRDIPYNRDSTVFSAVEQIAPLIAPKKPGIMYVAMIATGDISADKITPRDGSSIDGIRITFHQHEWEQAWELAQKLMEKGYEVFVQPVGATSYTDAELLEMAEKVNRLRPFSFYIVDTLGAMYQNTLLRVFYILDNNLDPQISVGYHAHNNLQLAFANAQALMSLHTKRRIILDASVFGMGRAAGNLCTELVTQYINANVRPKYDVTPLLEIVDDYLAPIYSSTPWGYSVPYYLAAVGGVHPDYAAHLINKQTISVKAIGAILSQLPDNKKDLYDADLIEGLYLRFQSNEIDDSADRLRLRTLLEGRTVLLLAPGKALQTHEAQINDFIDHENPFVVTVNFVTDCYRQDLVFVSNQKRFEGLLPILDRIGGPVAVTSNIPQRPAEERFLTVNYASLLSHEAEGDNSGIMLLRLLEALGVAEAYLAGFDGFSANAQDNFYTREMVNSVGRAAISGKNSAIEKQLIQLGERISLRFLTPSGYQKNLGAQRV